jgi:hypothetical protein
VPWVRAWKVLKCEEPSVFEVGIFWETIWEGVFGWLTGKKAWKIGLHRIKRRGIIGEYG